MWCQGGVVCGLRSVCEKQGCVDVRPGRCKRDNAGRPREHRMERGGLLAPSTWWLRTNKSEPTLPGGAGTRCWEQEFLAPTMLPFVRLAKSYQPGTPQAPQAPPATSQHTCAPVGRVLQLWCGGDGRPLLSRHGLGAVKQPHKAAALLHLCVEWWVCVGVWVGASKE
jgi:hypothetical protein